MVKADGCERRGRASAVVAQLSVVVSWAKRVSAVVDAELSARAPDSLSRARAPLSAVLRRTWVAVFAARASVVATTLRHSSFVSVRPPFLTARPRALLVTSVAA